MNLLLPDMLPFYMQGHFASEGALKLYSPDMFVVSVRTKS